MALQLPPRNKLTSLVGVNAPGMLTLGVLAFNELVLSICTRTPNTCSQPTAFDLCLSFSQIANAVTTAMTAHRSPNSPDAPAPTNLKYPCLDMLILAWAHTMTTWLSSNRTSLYP